MSYLCPFCEEYAHSGNTYCRMCGSCVRSAEDRPEAGTHYEPHEKYCGECGLPRSNCRGLHRS